VVMHAQEIGTYNTASRYFTITSPTRRIGLLKPSALLRRRRYWKIRTLIARPPTTELVVADLD
jgi:hypothetical protein